MKIIKHGRDMSQTVECPTCGAKIKYQPGDIEGEREALFAGGPQPCDFRYITFIRCPDCKKKIML